MASHESEDLQLRQEEIDILNSIYIDELLIRNNKCGIAECIEIVLHPATAGQAHQQYVCLTLLLHIPEAYPNAEPRITIKNPRGISDEFVDSLKRSLEEHATENLGNQVLFTLIQHAKDSLTYNNTPSCDCAVCLIGFQDEDAFTKTECYHYFHISCLERYIDVCTKDHEKEVAEIEERGMPQQKGKKLQIVCPVCREPISYVSDLENKKVGDLKPVEDVTFEPDKSMKRWQEKMRRLYKKQKEQGGIIDVEAESNRFLLDISTTVSTPLLSTLTSGDDRNSSAPKSEYRDKRGNTDHSKSRRDNYHKYGNRSTYRYGERQQSSKERKQYTDYGRKEDKGNDDASDDEACEKLSMDPKAVLNPKNDIKDVPQDNLAAKDDAGSNQTPVELPDIRQLEEDPKEDKLNEEDHQMNDNASSGKADSCDKVSDNITQLKLIDTEQQKDIGLVRQPGQRNENEKIQKDRRTQNERRGGAQDNRKSKSWYNHEQKGARSNYYRTGEKKLGNWRNRDEQNCTKDERVRQSHRRSGGATAGNQHRYRSGRGAMVGKNHSETSEKRSLEKRHEASDGALKEPLHSSSFKDEQGKGNIKPHSAGNPTSRKDDDDKLKNNRHLRENNPIKKDGQSTSSHHRFRNQRHFQRGPQKYPGKADQVRHSAVAKQFNRKEKFKKDDSELKTRSGVSNEAAGRTDDSKKATTGPLAGPPDVPLASPPDVASPSDVPPGFKSKAQILPPPGFD